MSVLTPPTPGLPAPSFPLWPISVDRYHQMIERGVLTENDAVELIEGYLVPKMSRDPAHDATVQIANRRLLREIPAEWDIRVQSAITLSDSEPEPDLAVVRGSGRTFIHAHPRPGDIGALMEVANSSLEFDRTVKGAMYARAGIAIYWIINLVDGRIEVYTDPTGPSPAPCYRQRQDFALGDALPLVLGGQELTQIPVRELLP